VGQARRQTRQDIPLQRVFPISRIVEVKGQLLLVDSLGGVMRRFLVPKQSVAIIEVLPEVRKWCSLGAEGEEKEERPRRA